MLTTSCNKTRMYPVYYHKMKSTPDAVYGRQIM